MKKLVIFFFSSILLFNLSQCQSTQETDAPKEDSRKQDSTPVKRDMAASSSPRGTGETPSEVIDLNQIQIIPMPNPDSKLLKITKNKDGIPVALLSLETSNAGLDLIGSILKGEILEHAIVIRNEKGEEIGRAPINVVEYEIEEIATNKGEKKLLLTDSGAEIGIKKSSELPPVVRKARVRRFERNELIPQYVEINKSLKEGAYVSVNLELLYVKPFAEMDCYSSESGNELCSRDFHNSIQSEIQSSIAEKESLLKKAIAEMKDDISLPKEYREQLALRLRKTTNNYRSEIKSNVNEINREKLKSQTTGAYYYREWRLASSPKYFQITLVDSPRPEKKKKIITDYTYFTASETSTEAVEEENIGSKDIVIEVDVSKSKNAENKTSKESETQIPQDAKKVSLEQAQRQEIGVGSNCVIYLKSGKYFKGRIVSLEGYSNIQVEVSESVIEVPKKDIEVIYIPKFSAD